MGGYQADVKIRLHGHMIMEQYNSYYFKGFDV